MFLISLPSNDDFFFSFVLLGQICQRAQGPHLEGLRGAHSQPGPEGPAVRGQGETTMTPLARSLARSVARSSSVRPFSLISVPQRNTSKVKTVWHDAQTLSRRPGKTWLPPPLSLTRQCSGSFFSCLFNTAAKAEALANTRKKWLPTSDPIHIFSKICFFFFFKRNSS